MPAQPLKAMAVLVSSQNLSGSVLYDGGLAIGISHAGYEADRHGSLSGSTRSLAAFRRVTDPEAWPATICPEQEPAVLL